MKIFVYSASLKEDSVNLKLSKLIAKVAEAGVAPSLVPRTILPRTLFSSAPWVQVLSGK